MLALGNKFLRGALALLLFMFIAGALPLNFGRPAEAGTKKIVHKKRAARKARPKKVAKKPKKKSARKTIKKAKKAVLLKKKTAAAKPARRPAPVDDFQYQLPSRSGAVTQRYSLEEGVGGDEADNVVKGLQSVGADDVSVDPSTNLVTITYNTSKLTAVGVTKKLKSLGFTAKRIY
jgi:hypothetical protein